MGAIKVVLLYFMVVINCGVDPLPVCGWLKKNIKNTIYRKNCNPVEGEQCLLILCFDKNAVYFGKRREQERMLDDVKMVCMSCGAGYSSGKRSGTASVAVFWSLSMANHLTRKS